MDPYPITPRQRDALRFIAGYQAAKGYSPSFNEIAAGLALTTRNSVRRLVRGLTERGHLQYLPNRARALDVLAPPPIPRAPDGAPLYFIPAPVCDPAAGSPFHASGDTYA